MSFSSSGNDFGGSGMVMGVLGPPETLLLMKLLSLELSCVGKLILGGLREVSVEEPLLKTAFMELLFERYEGEVLLCWYAEYTGDC